MFKTFIKSPLNLLESHRLEDHLDFSAITEKCRSELSQIRYNSLYGVIGGYGNGKSTMLYQISQKPNADEIWVQFDAWKFPERNNLWEGFVLDFVRDVNPLLFDKVRRKVDGTQKNPLKALISVIAQGADFFAPGASILKNLNLLFQTSPAKRVYEFQDILRDFINNEIKNKKKIYIIVEDIDRSGDKGMFFLETLKQFISTIELNKTVVVIVPISDQSFNDPEYKQSYIKTLDYRFIFNPIDIKFVNYVKKLIHEEYFEPDEPWADHLDMILRYLVSRGGLRIREIKTIIRDAGLKFESLEPEISSNLDVRILIMFAALKYLGVNQSVIINGKLRLRITEHSWIRDLLIFIANKTVLEGSLKMDIPIEFVDNPSFKTPKLNDKQLETTYQISKAYLNVF